MARTRRRSTRSKTSPNPILQLSVLFAFIALVVVIAMLFQPKQSSPYEKEIREVARKYDLPISLVKAVIRQESNFKEDAVSRVGAKGLMQIMPETGAYIAEKKGEDFQEEMLFDAKLNLDYGAWYLRYLLDQFENIPTSLAAYNAGPNAVKAWLEDENYSSDGKSLSSIPYPETSGYVENVMKYYESYAKKE